MVSSRRHRNITSDEEQDGVDLLPSSTSFSTRRSSSSSARQDNSDAPHLNLKNNKDNNKKRVWEMRSLPPSSTSSYARSRDGGSEGGGEGYDQGGTGYADEGGDDGYGTGGQDDGRQGREGVVPYVRDKSGRGKKDQGYALVSQADQDGYGYGEENDASPPPSDADGDLEKGGHEQYTDDDDEGAVASKNKKKKGGKGKKRRSATATAAEGGNGEEQGAEEGGGGGIAGWSQRKKLLVFGGAGAVVVLIIIAGVLLYMNNKDSSTSSSDSSSSSAEEGDESSSSVGKSSTASGAGTGSATNGAATSAATNATSAATNDTALSASAASAEVGGMSADAGSAATGLDTAAVGATATGELTSLGSLSDETAQPLDTFPSPTVDVPAMGETPAGVQVKPPAATATGKATGSQEQLDGGTSYGSGYGDDDEHGVDEEDGGSGEGEVTKYSTTATWFDSETFPHACHTTFSSSDYVAALSPSVFGNPNRPSPLCGAYLRVWQPESDQTITVQVGDVCEDCPSALTLSLSPSAFLALSPSPSSSLLSQLNGNENDAKLDVGVLSVQWWLADGEGRGGEVEFGLKGVGSGGSGGKGEKEEVSRAGGGAAMMTIR